jgi:undecaprenyl-diphosphatase
MFQFIDQTVLNFLAKHRTIELNFLMLIITYCGNYLVVVGVTILSSLSFWYHHHYQRILQLWIAVLGSSLSVFIIKNIFNISRPLKALYLENSPAFPSGHASIAVALYGFLFYTVWQSENHWFKRLFLILLAFLILLIGFSRLYLGVHYLSDVLIGYLIGSKFI